MMQLTNGTVLLLFFVATALFFWGVSKAVRTQKKIYLLAMLPFFLGMIGMFLL
ncbi:MAG: hypothetical protein IE885_08065 [Campylobacterales bacterium]|nr:hypothetical protein [Campylobacterales bacterium]